MLLAFILILILILMLRIRLRVHLEDVQKTAFFGLGRSGVEYNFISKKLSLRLIDRLVKELSFEGKSKKEEKEKKKPAKEKKEKPKRVRPLTDILQLIPKSSQALFRYTVSLFKSIIIEELEGQVSAGFDSPDLTGQLFGYYQAAYAAVPSVVGRVQYQPNWIEASFDAKLRASVAIPLYKILYRSIILFFSLPLRDIIKITIGRKERSHDG